MIQAHIIPRATACLRPIRPAAKRARHRSADHRETQNALKSAIFEHPDLMFVFKRSDTIIYSAVAGSIVDECTLPETGPEDAG